MNEMMQLMDWQDASALAFFIICWFSYSHYSDHTSKHNLVTVVNHYRLQWMREMLKRDNRSIDAIMVGNLTRSFTFFASTTMFIVAALVSLLGYHEQFSAIIADIPFAKGSTNFLWEIKILLLIVIFIYAFFKYTWSMRQYNYVSIFIAAAPDYRERPEDHERLAIQGAALTGNAARHFNNGMRAYYFGMAVLAWFVHPYLFIGITALLVYVTQRREYRSTTLKELSRP